MWERFTERAKHVVSAAKQEASRLHSEYVRTEHILLGLCQERDGIAARALENLGADIGFKSFNMDHHHYTRADLENAMERCRKENISTIVTTSKDWVKIKDLHPAEEKAEFLILKIKLKVKDEKDFFRRLSPLLSG